MEFKLNVIFGSGISSMPLFMIKPLLVSVETDCSTWERQSNRPLLCTGGRVGGVLATIHGVRPVCGTVPVLWRWNGTCCVAVLFTVGSRALRYQPGTLLAAQQTVAPAAQLYRLPAPPAIRQVTSLPTTTLPPQRHRSWPVINQWGCPRTFPPAIYKLQTTSASAVAHLTLFTVVWTVTNWTPAFFWKCNVTVASTLRKTAS